MIKDRARLGVGGVQNLCEGAETILTLGEVVTEGGGREPQVPWVLGYLLPLKKEGWIKTEELGKNELTFKL